VRNVRLIGAFAATVMSSIHDRHPASILALVCLLIGACNRRNAVDEPSITKSFGQRQLDQMLQDRRDMQGAIPSSHPMIAWVVDGFNGARLGQRIYWNANSPSSGRPAEHGVPSGAYPPYIAISGGAETTAIDKWASVVYEMINLESWNEFEKVMQLAMAGSLDADGFADKCVELEFAAMKHTRELFRKHPLPKSKHGKDTWYNWVTSEFGTYEDYKKAFDVSGVNTFNSNFSYFKEYYETSIRPYVDATRRTNG
jgi:hypothetical protein